jgi:CRP-like cAMP-binding protein
VVGVDPQFLRECVWFADVDSSDLGDLARSCVAVTAARDTWIFRQGQLPESLAILRNGRGLLVRSSGRDSELIIDMLTFRNTGFGAHHVLTARPLPLGLRAATRLDLIRIPIPSLHQLIERNPAVLRRLMVQMAHDIDAISELISDLGLLDLRRRVAKLLLKSADEDGLVRFFAPQHTVARRLGVSRQSLNKTMSALQRRGWIDRRGRGQVVLTDPGGLRRLLDS